MISGQHPAGSGTAFPVPDDEIYDGPAVLTLGGEPHPVRVRLIGELNPIDGRYHWRGTVFDAPEQTCPGPVLFAVDDRTVLARVTEQTPWGTYSIEGVGAPPFAHLLP